MHVRSSLLSLVHTCVINYLLTTVLIATAIVTSAAAVVILLSLSLSIYIYIGVLGIYGLIIAVILIQGVKPPYSSFSGYAHLSAGLSCGLSGLGAGLAIGIVGDAGVRANGIQPKLFVPMVLILIFAEALGLYGLIVGIILSQQTQACIPPGQKA